MTGTITTKTGRKNYYAVLNVYDETGKRKRKWIDTGVAVEGHNKRKANARLVEILAEYSRNDVDLTKDMIFMDFMAQHLEGRKLQLAPTTFDGYTFNFKAHIEPFFKPKKLKVKDVTPAVIQKYVNEKLTSGLSPNSVKRHLDNISSCLNSAVKQNIIAFNPVSRIEKPSVKKFTGAKFYNEKQIEQLLEVSKGEPLEIVILLTIFYGLRRSEILGLKWCAIDFEARTLTIKHTVSQVGKEIHRRDSTKNDSSHATFPMSDKIIARLMEWKEQQKEWEALQPNDWQNDEDYICIKPTGELMKPSYISRNFPLILKKNNMPHIRFHDLRHSSASFLHHLGFDLKSIQVWLRHKDIQTTMNLYTHLDMSAKTNIADTLDAKF